MAEGGGRAGGGGGGAADVGLAFLRLMAIGLAYHGSKKLFGGGMSGLADDVDDIGFPAPTVFAWAGAIAAVAGGAMVAIGFHARLGAVLAAATTFVVAFLALQGRSFERRELALAYLAIMLAVACLGPGRWSVDGMRGKG
jgi:putative oxidoreductase